MPELPEVETVVRGIRSVALDWTVSKIDFFRSDLRDEIPIKLVRKVLLRHNVQDVFRRGKYIVIQTDVGRAFLHLGMSGQLFFCGSPVPEVKHTHCIVTFDGESGESKFLHFVDPRRFGRISAHIGRDWEAHPFFREMGVEPLSGIDLATVLHAHGNRRTCPIKSLIMDGSVVVGVGNIYASESLFRARIHPEMPARDVSMASYATLASAIQDTLTLAIKAGGTTLRDFRKSDGKAGYFAIELNVYGREGLPCKKCGGLIKSLRQSGRSTFFCPLCQNDKNKKKPAEIRPVKKPEKK